MTERIWERRPDETDKSWAAFQVYRDMPILGPRDERRSHANLAVKLGYDTLRSLEDWSKKYDWVARCRAYDAYKGHNLLTVRETELADYQRAVVAQLTTNLAAMQPIVQQMIGRLNEALASGRQVSALELVRVAHALRLMDDLARRAGGMPTNFTTETVKAEDGEEQVFIIGG